LHLLQASSQLNRPPEVMNIANVPFLWLCALAVFVVIFIQSIIYIRAARKAAPAADMTNRELNQSLRAGAVASIGPSLAVVLVALALLTLFGTPAVLLRIGLIGSAATETASATMAAQTMGSALGDENYTAQVFAIAFIAMSISGGMWLIATLLMTPLLKRGSKKLSQVNPTVMTIIPGAALLGAFSMLTVTELPKSSVHLVTILASATTMTTLLWLAKVLNAAWLKEWAFGIAIFIGLVVAYLAHTV